MTTELFLEDNLTTFGYLKCIKNDIRSIAYILMLIQRVIRQ